MIKNEGETGDSRSKRHRRCQCVGMIEDEKAEELSRRLIVSGRLGIQVKLDMRGGIDHSAGAIGLS